MQIKHPERIEAIVIDMWLPYLHEVRKRFPRAAIVIDKFHVLQRATNAVMAVRNELREANKHLRLPRKDLLRKRFHELPPDAKSKLECRLKELPLLAEAHKLKEEFFNIWSLQDRSKAEERLDEWVGKIPDKLQAAFWPLVRAFRNFRQEILNYFDYLITNAFTESVNKLIKDMQRDGCGYTFDVARANLLYGSPFVTRRPSLLKIEKAATQTNNEIKKKERKRSKRVGSKPSRPSNVQQLTQIRQAEDEFRELMRPPAGYVERFKHFKQLDFDY